MKLAGILLTVLVPVFINAAGGDTDASLKLMALDMSADSAPDTVRELLDSGANPNYYIKGGDRPLFHAVKSGRKEIVTMLLDRGADPNVSYDDASGSPLDSAVTGGDPEMVRILIRGKADVAYKMRGAQTVLHSACLGKESPEVNEIITILISSGADVNAVTHYGVTPLMNASERGNTGAVKILISHGADPRIKNAQGKTALDFAEAGEKNQELIKILKSWKKKNK